MINANHKLVPTLFFLLVLLVIAVPVTAVAQMFLYEWYKRWSSLNKPVYTS